MHRATRRKARGKTALPARGGPGPLIAVGCRTMRGAVAMNTRPTDGAGAPVSAWRIATSAFLLGACAVVATAPLPAAQEEPPKSFFDRKLFRLEFDNDIFLGSDDAFSAGWSFQLHSRLMDTWNPGFAGWIGKVPGLGDDGQGGRVARFAVGLSQIMVTPNDTTIEAPQPNDAPWAGLVGATGTWSSYGHYSLAALQISVGCMGPCSQVEDVQKFVHNRLGAGEEPKSWGNQLSNQALGNVNYQYIHKLYVADPSRYAFGRFATDLAAGAQAGAGNVDTFARAALHVRFGWGMPMRSSHDPDPTR